MGDKVVPDGERVALEILRYDLLDTRSRKSRDTLKRNSSPHAEFKHGGLFRLPRELDCEQQH
jgi:hypothetical protein